VKFEKFENQIFFSTVRITIPSQTGTGASIGTGFMFRVDINDGSGRYSLLLISNRHVFGDPSQSIELNFNKKNGVSDEPLLGDLLTIRQTDFSNIYITHPDPDVDLACINITPIANIGAYYKNLYLDMLCEIDESNILPGADIWFVGYPENRFDIVHNLPIMRKGHIASIPNLDFNGKRQFVIDAQVFPGSSGSPVLADIDGHAKLIGVVTQMMIRNQKLQTIPANYDIGVQQVLGLGIVIKAVHVKELLELVVRNIISENPKEDLNEVG